MRSAGSYFAERPLLLAEQNMVLHVSIFFTYKNILFLKKPLYNNLYILFFIFVIIMNIEVAGWKKKSLMFL